jgi:hypothetical protein
MIAGGVPNGAITSSMIANGAVGTTQLAAGAVQSGNLAAGAVGSTQLAANAVQASNIADGAITAAQLAKPPRSGIVAGSTLPPFQTNGFFVPFDPAYAATPAVTVSLREPAPSTGAVEVQSVYPFGFGVTARQPETILVSEPSFPFGVAVAEIDGRPAMAYVDGGSLKFTRATNSTGTSWLAPVTIAASASGFVSLALVNGNPAMSYYGNSADLMFVRAGNASGSSWGAPIPVDTVGDVGQFSSLAALPSGNPAMAYYDRTNQNLKFVRATDANGSAWSTPLTVNSSPRDVGQFASLKAISVFPAISYYDATNGDLFYVQANDADGASWPSPILVDGAGDVGRFCTMAQGMSGPPVICYSDYTNGDLKFARRVGTDFQIVTVDSSGAAARAVITSLVHVNGVPIIAYINNFPLFISDPHGDLKVVRASDPDGNTWGTPATLQTALRVPEVALKVINGGAAIGYSTLSSLNGGPAAGVRFRRLMPDYDIHWIALPP